MIVVRPCVMARKDVSNVVWLNRLEVRDASRGCCMLSRISATSRVRVSTVIQIRGRVYEGSFLTQSRRTDDAWLDAEGLACNRENASFLKHGRHDHLRHAWLAGNQGHPQNKAS